MNDSERDTREVEFSTKAMLRTARLWIRGALEVVEAGDEQSLSDVELMNAELMVQDAADFLTSIRALRRAEGRGNSREITD